MTCPKCEEFQAEAAVMRDTVEAELDQLRPYACEKEQPTERYRHCQSCEGRSLCAALIKTAAPAFLDRLRKAEERAEGAEGELSEARTQRVHYQNIVDNAHQVCDRAGLRGLPGGGRVGLVERIKMLAKHAEKAKECAEKAEHVLRLSGDMREFEALIESSEKAVRERDEARETIKSAHDKMDTAGVYGIKGDHPQLLGRIELLVEARDEVQARVKGLEANLCDQCDGSGQYYIDGEPRTCICVGEKEPYRRLEVRVKELEAQLKGDVRLDCEEENAVLCRRIKELEAEAVVTLGNLREENRRHIQDHDLAKKAKAEVDHLKHLPDAKEVSAEIYRLKAENARLVEIVDDDYATKAEVAQVEEKLKELAGIVLQRFGGTHLNSRGLLALRKLAGEEPIRDDVPSAEAEELERLRKDLEAKMKHRDALAKAVESGLITLSLEELQRVDQEIELAQDAYERCPGAGCEEASDDAAE